MPAQLSLGDLALQQTLDLAQGLLNGGGELVLVAAIGLGVADLNGLVEQLLQAGALQSGDLQHGAAQLVGHLHGVDLVAVLLHHVHHVQGDDNGDAHLHDLGGQIQVALQVGGVHQVDDHVGVLVNDVVPADDLLQGVGGQGVDTGQVGDHSVGIAPQLALFLLHGNAGPVANVLVGAGHGVEHGGLSAVGIAHQRDFNGHESTLLLKIISES